MFIVIKKFRLISIVLITTLISVAHPLTASALTITPVRHVVTLEGGKSSAVSVTIHNDEATGSTFTIVVLGGRQDTAGRPVFKAGTDRAEAWVKPATSSIFLAAGARATIPFTITVPSDAAPASHYLGLAVEKKARADTGTAVGARLVTILALQVAGRVDEHLVLRAAAPRLLWKGRLFPLDITLHNESNIEVPLRGEVTLYKTNGTVVKKEPLVIGNPLLSGAQRAVTVHVASDDLSLGHYQGVVAVTYGATGQVAKQTFSLWYVPVPWAAGIIVVVLGSSIWLLRRGRKQTSKKL